MRPQFVPRLDGFKQLFILRTLEFLGFSNSYSHPMLPPSMHSKAPVEKTPSALGGTTRERILSAAAATFSARGYRGGTIREICRKAHANVAAIKYHFGSKAKLYFGVFEWLYAEFATQMACEDIGEIHTADQWEAALLDWTRSVLAIVLSENPRDQWKIRLFRRERSDPSEVLPLILDRFYVPILKRIEQLICLGMPPGTPPARVRTWAVSALAQCTVYSERTPPWDQYLFPPDTDRVARGELLARHIVDGITSRLTFQRGAGMENGCIQALAAGKAVE